MHRYALALGSNRRHGRHGRPDAVLIVASLPLGGGGRRYANGVAIVATKLDPPALLALLKRIERGFGRRAGRRWAPRVLDLDILLWSGGRWGARVLHIPHPRMAERRFVLRPLAAVASGWRLPGRALAIRHLAARLAAPAPVDRRNPRS